MKIAVCVKEVPDATVHKRIDPDTKRLDRSGEGALNAFDANAVEEALRLKDATGEGEVVVLSMGPERALNSLRKALAMGADRAVLVTDDGAAGSDLVATSAVLAQALEREEADLVLFGQQSSDSRRRRALGGRRRAAAAPGHLAGRGADARRRLADRQAPDRVRLRRHPRAAPGGGRRRRLDQRAALPVAEGDHGREEEAAGAGLARRPRPRRRRGPASRARARRCSRSPIRRRAATRGRSRTTAARPSRSSSTWRRSGCCEHPRLPRAPRATSSRRARSPCSRRPRSSARETSPASSSGRASPTLAGAGREARRGDGLRRRRRAPRRAAAAAARRRDRAARRRARHRDGPLRAVGARRGHRLRPRGAARRGAQLAARPTSSPRAAG